MTLHLDFRYHLNLLCFGNFLKKGKNSEDRHYNPPNDPKNEPVTWIGNNFRDTEKGSNNNQRITNKNPKSQRDPYLQTMLDAGLQKCKHRRSQCDCNCESEYEAFEKWN